MESTQITEKYVRKPLYVDAVQVTKENFIDVARWCFGEIVPNNPDTDLQVLEDPNPDECHIHVRVHNPKNAKQTQAHVGDWILYTERGYKVYTTKAFLANFDKVKTGAEEVQELPV